ncbi:DUF2501 domain-containing protein [Escherichia coli]
MVSNSIWITSERLRWAEKVKTKACDLVLKQGLTLFPDCVNAAF